MPADLATSDNTSDILREKDFGIQGAFGTLEFHRGPRVCGGVIPLALVSFREPDREFLRIGQTQNLLYRDLEPHDFDFCGVWETGRDSC